jgi:hypothetical protein
MTDSNGLIKALNMAFTAVPESLGGLNIR